MDDTENGAGSRLGDHSGEFADIRLAFDSLAQPQSKSRPDRPAKSIARSPARRSARSKSEVSDDDAADAIIGSSPQAVALRDKISLYAKDDSPVLISGETGVGKELVARQIHVQSSRNHKSFKAVNAGAIPESLAAGELFGHAKGAFTGAVSDRAGAFAAADGGTLFLDEISELPIELQSYFLRVLEDGKVQKLGGNSTQDVDFRLVSATNIDLRGLTATGRFRLDLYYRINVLFIHVPPLRERGEDAVEIAESIIASHPNPAYRLKRLTPNAADLLKRHDFPGNVRELRNIIVRALVHASENRILPEHLVFDNFGRESSATPDRFNVTEAKKLVNRVLILKALKSTDGNVSKAAELTGRSRSSVHTLKREINGEDILAEYKSACDEIKALLDAT